MLVSCTPNTIIGTISTELPGIEVHEDVLYGPIHDHGWHDDPRWGIYDLSGQIIDAGAYYRGPGKQLVGQNERIDTSLVKYDEAPDREYLYGGVFIEHFGHFITSSLSRFWPFLDKSLEAGLANMKILCHGVFGPSHWFTFPYISEPLTALRLEPSRFVGFSQPTHIKRLIIPRVSFEEHNSVHTVYVRLTREIGRRLLGDVYGKTAQPVYLSRSMYPALSQGFENEIELISILQSLGVRIVFPELLSFADQIRIFAENRVVLGTISSAFHASVFVQDHPTSICLSPSPMVNPNFNMLDRVTSQDARYFLMPAQSLGHSPGDRIRHKFLITDPKEVAREMLVLLQQICL